MNPTESLKKIFRLDAAIGLCLAIATFGVYLSTMASTVGTEDPGELATSLYTLGIVHPTGYPLFTMLGWMFAHLPLGESVIWRLNLFGAILTSTATFVFYRTFAFFFSPHSVHTFQTVPPGGSEKVRRLIAAVTTLTFAFSAIYWREAVSLEVYALHLVFLALVCLLFLRAVGDNKAPARPGASTGWLLFAFVLGLSFTNHMMTVLLAPAFLFLFFRTFGWTVRAWKLIATAAPVFLLPLSLYLYLPLRSFQNPIMNWGEPKTIEALWKHLTAAQYGQMMFSSWEIAFRKLAQFAVDLPGEFGYAPLGLALIGLWYLGRTARILLVFTLLVFAGCLFYGVNYAFDDPNFYLNAHFMVALWCGFGMLALVVHLSGSLRKIVLALCTGVFLFPLAFNYADLDKTQDRAVQEYAVNVLGSMDSGAVLFTNEYERLGSPAFYLQIVEGYRPDIVVLDIILLGNPWFYNHLEQRFPWLMQASQAPIAAYRREVDKYVRGEPDTVAHNAALREMFLDIIAKSRATGRPVYVSAGINTDALENYELSPSGMVFKVFEPDEPLEVGIRDFHYTPLPESNPLSETIRLEYAESYGNQGTYLLYLGDTARAVERMEKALRIAPEFTDVATVLGGLKSPR